MSTTQRKPKLSIRVLYWDNVKNIPEDPGGNNGVEASGKVSGGGGGDDAAEELLVLESF